MDTFNNPNICNLELVAYMNEEHVLQVNYTTKRRADNNQTGTYKGDRQSGNHLSLHTE